MIDGTLPGAADRRDARLRSGRTSSTARRCSRACRQFRHYNPLGTVHGGFAMTLLDSCLGCCVHTTLAKGEGYTTLEVKVNLVRAITKDTGQIRATGRLIHRGRTTATAEGDIRDAAGNLLAHGTTTCMIFPAKNDCRRQSSRTPRSGDPGSNKRDRATLAVPGQRRIISCSDAPGTPVSSRRDRAAHAGLLDRRQRRRGHRRGRRRSRRARRGRCGRLDLAAAPDRRRAIGIRLCDPAPPRRSSRARRRGA